VGQAAPEREVLDGATRINLRRPEDARKLAVAIVAAKIKRD
jgi:hypothetical protein